jgi:hypothetical protein
MPSETQHIIDSIIRAIRDLPPDERVELLEQLGNAICLECGCDQEARGMKCQCWNDE